MSLASYFCVQVCLTKALSTGPTPSSLFTLDLVAGEGGALQTGDSVEVKYTGKLLTNNTFGQVFDSNVNADKLFRFKLGAGKVIKVDSLVSLDKKTFTYKISSFKYLQ